MEAWFKENRGYVITVGSLVGGVLLVYMFLLGPITSDAENIGIQLRMQENVHRSKARQGVPDEGAIADARRERDAERTSLKEGVARLGVSLENRFRSRGEDGYREHFEEIKLSVRDHLKEVNGKRGLGEFPSDLGWKGVPLESQEEGKDALLRLGVGKGLLEAVIASLGKGEKITQVNIFEGWDRQEEGEATFLRRVPIRIKMTASSRSIFRTIHRFQKSGSYFCLETIRVQREATTGQDLFEADMVVSGLLVDPNAPPPFEGEEDFE